MREFDQAFTNSGIAVRGITIGSQTKAAEFCARHNPAAICIGDADVRTYKAMGFGDFDLSLLQTTPALNERRAQNEAAGFVQDWAETRLEDAAQNPGAAAIDARGVLRWIYRGIHPGDLPPMATMPDLARTSLGLV